MRRYAGLSVLAGICVLAACSSSESSNPVTTDTGTTGDATGDSGGDAKPKCASVGGRVQGTTGGEFISGAKVCVYKHDEIPCVTTKDVTGDGGIKGGTYVFECVPPDENLAFVFSATGYYSVLMPFPAVPAGSATLRGQDLFKVDEATVIATATGSTYPPPAGKTFVGGALYNKDDTAKVGGATVTSSSGAKAFYTNAAGVPDATVTATDAEGRFVFADIPVSLGEIELTTSKDCTLRYGWPSTKANTVKVPLAEGLVTIVSFSCTP